MKRVRDDGEVEYCGEKCGDDGIVDLNWRDWENCTRDSRIRVRLYSGLSSSGYAHRGIPFLWRWH